MDDVDRGLLVELQRDATQSYAALGASVGLSAGAAHERVRKLRERKVIQRTTIDVDPDAVGRTVLAFVLLHSDAWVGDEATHHALVDLTEVEEAHVIAGAASLLVKVRAASTEHLQDVLRRFFAIEGVTKTETVVVLQTFFERPVPVTTSRPRHHADPDVSGEEEHSR